MSTQLTEARAGRITSEMEAAAADEGCTAEFIRDAVARGHAVIPCNPAHKNVRPVVVGSKFKTKINANIGRSPVMSCDEEEVAKVEVALSAGADFLMDLSVGEDLEGVRQSIIQACPAPVGTVPIYEALSRVGGDSKKLTDELLLEVIRDQAEQGVDFMTLHAGLKREHVPLAVKRLMGICSRGGAILAEWMQTFERENPLLERWDDVLEICLKHDVTVSLGDGLRPGCLADASDAAQFAELDALGELVASCREAGVQVMVEGPGHVPFDQIQMNMERQIDVCDGAPFYVLGPVVTDIAPGYDHITSSIGATAAAYHGAALLCYVTPAEHLCLPKLSDVHEGVIAYKIAAHAADVAKGIPGVRERDDAMAHARINFDWEKQFELALDGKLARKRYEEQKSDEEGEADHCSMCGREFCAVRTTKRLAEDAG